MREASITFDFQEGNGGELCAWQMPQLITQMEEKQLFD
jgi:hypothetical protein